MDAIKHTTAFRLNIGLALGLFALLVMTFIVYVFTEKELDRANHIRHQSLLLADELRQSSNDLTHMARSYIVTADPRYQAYYHEIIAIRDGAQARPQAYQNIYWELVLIDKRPAPSANDRTVSITKLIQEAGFSAAEMARLAEARKQSSALTAIEVAAMELVANAGGDLDSRRNQALALLFGANYNRAKAAIMEPINQFYSLMSQRTEAAVVRAEYQALIARGCLIALGLILVFIQWRISCALRTTLGGSVVDIYRQIRLLGTGDFSATIRVSEDQKHSVLAWLAETQRNLLELQQRDEQFRQSFKLIPNPLTLQDKDGIILDCSDAFCAITGYSREEIIGLTTQALGIWVDPKERDLLRERIMCDGKVDNLEFQLRRRNGEVRSMQLSARFLTGASEPILVGVAHDVTPLKDAELALQESVLHTQAILDNMFDGVITINTDGAIESFNTAASRIFGYPSHEVLGQNITLLMPAQYRNQHHSHLQQHDNNAGVKVLNVLRSVEGQRKNGDIFPMSLSITKILRHGKITFVGVIRDISQQRRDEEEIYRLAFYDPLTNLPNRRLLFDRLKQAIITSCRTDQHGALMFLDLDHFKQLNDSLGHDVGDILLQQVALRLQSCVRECDSVARMGGDEFVMLIEALSIYPNEAASQAEAIAHKILAKLAAPYHLREHTYVITPSIGIMVFLHQDESLEELLKKADVAMYQAKTAGRNNARFFDPTMQAAVSVRVALEKSMRQALQRNEFLLHYQLQVNSAGAPIGVEALVRWNHAEHGMVAPASFIALAEETGMILDLGQWVLETACMQLVRWAKNPETAALTMAVNVSVSQFAQPHFVDTVDKALHKTGANPHLLKLELTESMLAKDVDEVVIKMFEIKALGVTFSLDDFGTGYSSLSYLKRLPLDQLKIDQSFVRDLLTDPNDATIARTIIALGHSLSLQVIAEGVETQAQRDALADMGCDAYQGYYFGRPVPAEELLLQLSTQA